MKSTLDVLIETLSKGKIEKDTVPQNVLKRLKALRLLKVARRYIYPWKFDDFVDIDNALERLETLGPPVEVLVTVTKLGTRLIRGLEKKNPILYSQGVLGLRTILSCDYVPDMKFLAQVYAHDQMSPIHVNELLIVMPTSCSFWNDKSLTSLEIAILEAFFGVLSDGSDDRSLALRAAYVHGRYYDSLISYIKKLQKKVSELRVVLSRENPKELETLESVLRKSRNSFDRMRSLIRSCSIIESLYERYIKKKSKTRVPLPPHLCIPSRVTF